jgi:hypothetical protein
MARAYPSQADLEGGEVLPDRVVVENVDHPGQVTRVDAAKYAAMRGALLRVLPAGAPGTSQSELTQAVLRHLPREHFPGGAKAGWWTGTVLHDLEAKGLVQRLAGRPLRWRRT